MRTPDTVLQEALGVMRELRRAAEAVHDAQLKAEQASEAHKAEFAAQFLTATGSVEERKQKAVLGSQESADCEVIHKAQLTRVKQKIRGLESSLSLLQSELRYMKDQGA